MVKKKENCSGKTNRVSAPGGHEHPATPVLFLVAIGTERRPGAAGFGACNARGWWCAQEGGKRNVSGCEGACISRVKGGTGDGDTRC